MNNVWRIRMRAGDFGDFSAQAWQRGEIGVWYGGWSADDFSRTRNDPERRRALSESPGHQPVRVHWGLPEVPTSYLNTATRFADVPEDDWVLVAFKLTANSQPAYYLGLGHLERELLSEEEHPLNQHYSGPEARELFKFRRLRNQKQFRLSNLPEVFRLIPQTGRGNVFQFGDLNMIVSWLAEADTEEDVWNRLRGLSLRDLIHALGPKGWESLAEAYLILEEDYVPVGLVVGKTLKTFDLLGRSFRDRASIAASCKNNRHKVALPEDFRDAVREMEGTVRAYFFAYGGCSDASLPANVTVIDGQRIVEWLETQERGREWLSLLLPE